MPPVKSRCAYLPENLLAGHGCAAKSHLAPRPELPPARKNIAPFELCHCAAVLVIRDIAPSNEYRLGQRHEPGDLAANRRDSSLRDVFCDRVGLAPTVRFARRPSAADAATSGAMVVSNAEGDDRTGGVETQRTGGPTQCTRAEATARHHHYVELKRASQPP